VKTSCVVFQSDPQLAQLFIASLATAFQSVRLATSLEDARMSAIKHRAEALIVDMEAASLDDVRYLSRELPTTRIVCNHRVADEKLWIAALNAGADDCCASSDRKAIVNAALGRPNGHSEAA
jgi:DNA-binding NarL/FixJ family response regulator